MNTPNIAQETLTPVEVLVVAPDQEILYAANSEEATAPLCSQTISIAADAKVSERASYDPSKSEDAQIEMVLQLIQDSLFQPEAFVAAPAQEIPTAANSDAATEAIESH